MQLIRSLDNPLKNVLVYFDEGLMRYKGIPHVTECDLSTQLKTAIPTP